MQLKLEAMGDSRSVWSVTDLERSKKNSIQNTPSFTVHIRAGTVRFERIHLHFHVGRRILAENMFCN